MKNTIEQIIHKFGFGMSVEDLAESVYRELSQTGVKVCIMNERYIKAQNANFQLIKSRSKGHWTVREF